MVHYTVDVVNDSGQWTKLLWTVLHQCGRSTTRFSAISLMSYSTVYYYNVHYYHLLLSTPVNYVISGMIVDHFHNNKKLRSKLDHQDKKIWFSFILLLMSSTTVYYYNVHYYHFCPLLLIMKTEVSGKSGHCNSGQQWMTQVVKCH